MLANNVESQIIFFSGIEITIFHLSDLTGYFYIHKNFVYNVIKYWQVNGNKLDNISLKMVSRNTIESESIQWHKQIILIIGFLLKSTVV